MGTQPRPRLLSWLKTYSLALANTYEHSDLESAELVRKDLAEIIEICNKSPDVDFVITTTDVREIICELKEVNLLMYMD